MKGSLGSWGTYFKGQADKVGENVASRTGSPGLSGRSANETASSSGPAPVAAQRCCKLQRLPSFLQTNPDHTCRHGLHADSKVAADVAASLFSQNTYRLHYRPSMGSASAMQKVDTVPRTTTACFLVQILLQMLTNQISHVDTLSPDAMTATDSCMSCHPRGPATASPARQEASRTTSGSAGGADATAKPAPTSQTPPTSSSTAQPASQPAAKLDEKLFTLGNTNASNFMRRYAN